MHYQSIFLSDIHLRTRWCHSEQLYNFLISNTCENLFLVGDIIDGWNIHNGYVDAYQCRVVGELLEHPNAKLFIGNHETDLELVKEILPTIPVFDSLDYTTIAGEKLLITHGHEFDSLRFMNRVSSYRKLYSIASTKGDYRLIKWITNMAFYLLERDLSNFKNKAISKIVNTTYDGIITGHTHFPEKELIDHKYYYNDGDWITHDSALVEDTNGRLFLI